MLVWMHTSEKEAKKEKKICYIVPVFITAATQTPP
jgi:hypothetical protein